MVCHILCPECSEDLAEVYPLFIKIKQGYCDYLINKKKNPIHIDKMELKLNVITNFEFIFDTLRINNPCCRIHMLGNTDFDSNYY